MSMQVRIFRKFLGAMSESANQEHAVVAQTILAGGDETVDKVLSAMKDNDCVRAVAAVPATINIGTVWSYLSMFMRNAPAVIAAVMSAWQSIQVLFPQPTPTPSPTPTPTPISPATAKSEDEQKAEDPANVM